MAITHLSEVLFNEFMVNIVRAYFCNILSFGVLMLKQFSGNKYLILLISMASYGRIKLVSSMKPGSGRN